MTTTLKKFNVRSGLSVGTQIIDVIDANGNATFDSTTSNSLTVNNDAFVTGNLSVIGNIVGNISNAINSTTATTVTGNAQSNITSVGTLTNLTVSGITTLGNVGNVSITGGTGGQTLITDGAGNLSWGSVPASTIVNGTSNVSIPLVNGPLSFSVGGTVGVLTVNRISSSIGSTLLPQSNNAHSLGNAQFRWASTFSANVSTNTVFGLANANSNISFTSTGINVSANGTANVVTISTTGMAVTGRSSATEFFVFPTYTVANLRAITGQAGWTAAVSDSSPGGKLAYWNTTHSHWAYVFNDSAV